MSSIDCNWNVTGYDERRTLINYLKMKADTEDWHAVADAAMDLRELDARDEAYDLGFDNGRLDAMPKATTEQQKSAAFTKLEILMPGETNNTAKPPFTYTDQWSARTSRCGCRCAVSRD